MKCVHTFTTGRHKRQADITLLFQYIYIYICIYKSKGKVTCYIKSEIYWDIFFTGIILLLIIASQGTHVQHNKMIYRVQTLVCMVKVTGHDNHSFNIQNHRPIQKSVHHDKTKCRICPRLRSQVIFLLKMCCRIIICKAFDQLLNLCT